MAGVSAAAQATAAAQARGATPADIRGLLAEFRAEPGAWQPGALYRRVTGELSTWPEPSAEYQSKLRQASSTAAADAKAEVREQANHRRTAERERADQLARDYGRNLDAMSDTERQKLLATAIPNLAERRITGKNMQRRAMLEQMEKRPPKKSTLDASSSSTTNP